MTRLDGLNQDLCGRIYCIRQFLALNPETVPAPAPWRTADVILAAIGTCMGDNLSVSGPCRENATELTQDDAGWVAVCEPCGLIMHGPLDGPSPAALGAESPEPHTPEGATE